MLTRDGAAVAIARWVYHAGDDMGVGTTLLNLYGTPVPEELQPYVQATGGHTFVPAGVLAAWACYRELPPPPAPPAPARPQRPRRGRPYRLGHTSNGIVFEQWGRYGSAEAAWRRADRDMAELGRRRLLHHLDGWLVVTGPDGYQEARGVGRNEGEQLPTYRATGCAKPTKETTP